MPCGQHSPRKLLVFAFLLAVVPVGCGGSTIDPVAARNLKAVAELYCDFAFAHKSNGPANEQALKNHARKMDRRNIESLQIDINKLDEVFTSPRDQQPLKVLYGRGISNLGQNAPLIAHETTGVRGMRLAVFANGRLEELDEAGLQKAIDGPK
jgi:hypothetical protein